MFYFLPGFAIEYMQFVNINQVENKKIQNKITDQLILRSFLCALLSGGKDYKKSNWVLFDRYQYIYHHEDVYLRYQASTK